MPEILEIKEIIPFLIPLLVIQVCLQVYSIINLIKRRKVRLNNKFVWALIILVLGLIGAITYLIFRGDEE